MPAASDSGLVPLPHTWRPLGPRVAGIVAGAVVLVITVFLWLGFDDATRASVTPFQRGTVVAFGLLAASVIHALARSRADAEIDGLVVVNGYRRHVYEWPEVITVSLPRGAPWAMLDLADGTSQAVMGIQGSDGDRAIRAVRELRQILRAG